MPTDWELLERYAAKNDQAAFAEIAARHVDFVHGSARRMLGGPAHEAQDVVQAVFLLLSRKAATIRRRGALAGWLFRATRYCCANVTMEQDRRRRRERAAAFQRPESTTPGANMGDDLNKLLDDALNRLGEKERQAILVRYLEGKTVAETGAVLGISAEAVEKRLERGIGKLRAAFARKGFIVPAAALTGAMIAERANAAPAGLAASVAGVTGGASAAAAGIANGAAVVMKRMMMVKTVAMATCALLLLAILGTGFVEDIRTNAAEIAVAGTHPAPVAAAAPARVARTYTVTSLGTLGGKASWASAINASGQIVGASDTAEPGKRHAFVYRDGKMTDLGTLGGNQSRAMDINDAGKIVGGADVDPAQPDGQPPAGARPVEHAFLYDRGEMHDLGTLGGIYSIASKINASGQIIGESDRNPLDMIGGEMSQSAFLYNNGKMQGLGGSGSLATAITDAGEIVGASLFDKPDANGVDSLHAFIYEKGHMQDLGLSGALSTAVGINAAGQIICNANGAPTDAKAQRWRAILYSKGRATDIGTLGGNSSRAKAINASGKVVGYADTGKDGEHAFLFDHGRLLDLNTLVSEKSLRAAKLKVLLQATAINDAGRIVGIARDAEGNEVAFLLAPKDNKAPATQTGRPVK